MKEFLILFCFIFFFSLSLSVTQVLQKEDHKEWPRYCRKGYMTLFRTGLLAFARPKWTKMVHFGPFWPKEVYFGPFRSTNRTLATPEINKPGWRRWRHDPHEQELGPSRFRVEF